jgi:aminopeptidase N
LSEGFATYLTHFYRELTYGRDQLEAGMRQDREEVVEFFAGRPELALIPTQLSDPGEMLNDNAYEKGGWLLHMLRRQVGEDAFFEGIRGFYRRYRDATALTDDFRLVMEEASGQNLEWFFDQWAERPGHPVLEAELSYDPGTRLAEVTLRQLQEGGAPFRFSIDVAILGPDQAPVAAARVEVEEREHTFSLLLESTPGRLELDPDAWLLFEEHQGPAPARNPRPENSTMEWKP